MTPRTPTRSTKPAARRGSPPLRRPGKPAVLPVVTKNVPSVLRKRPQWVVWKREWHDNRWGKVPYSPTGTRAKVNDPRTWSDYTTTVERYSRGGFDGIGFVFSKDDPFVGIDLDDCRDAGSGELTGWATSIIKGLDTYGEVSPSGTGVKLWAEGRLPVDNSGQRTRWEGGEVEIYQHGRFFAVTGHRLESSPSKINKRCLQISELWEGLSSSACGHTVGSGQAAAPAYSSPARSADDDALLSKASAARNGRKFKRLWNGDTHIAGGDPSAADLALCSLLVYWTGPDAQRIDRLFRRSGLMRAKWDEKHYANGDTYGQRTIKKALSGQKKFYAGPVQHRQTAVLREMSAINPQPVEWLWQDCIPVGKVTMICGDPDRGKSLLTIDLAARVTTGRPFPGFDSALLPASGVILLSAEDDPHDTIRPRLDAAGADTDKVLLMDGVEVDGAGGRREFNLDEHLPALEDALARHSGTRLVVIDPLLAYLGDTDSHRHGDVRGVLRPLAELAQRHHVAVVVVMHLNKVSGARAMYRATGSLAFVAAARAAWLVTKDPHDETRQFFVRMKNNLAASKSGYAYRIVDHRGVPRVEWDQERIELTADEAMADEELPAAVRPIDTAQEFLRESLAAGEKRAAEVETQARARGIRDATLRRAGKVLKIERRKVGFGEDTHWVWSLPKTLNPGPDPNK